jgi:hypothetical protein
MTQAPPPGPPPAAPQLKEPDPFGPPNQVLGTDPDGAEVVYDPVDLAAYPEN